MDELGRTPHFVRTRMKAPLFVCEDDLLRQSFSSQRSRTGTSPRRGSREGHEARPRTVPFAQVL